MHECNNNLKYYKDDNPSIIGRFCTNTCPDTNHKYISNDLKECLRNCPPGKYYVPDVYRECLDRCPDDYLFHKRDEFECKTILTCATAYADYNSKLCLDTCPDSKYIFEEKNSGSVIIKVCLNSCSDYGKYLTPDNKCVSSCDEDSSLNLEIDTSVNYKCKCKYYYYKDLVTFKTICLDNMKTCQDAGIYQIQKFGSTECIKKCNGILSLNEDFCYNENSHCGENTKVINENGQKKCECLYKFYYDESGVKKCLRSI